MGAIQVNSVPDELHEALRDRAARHGVSINAYVLELLRRELSKPSGWEWPDQVATRLSFDGEERS